MTITRELPIAGYVLAGGASSRMGTDKALVELGGKPLIEHAVGKLQQVCNGVRILSKKVELARYSPLVPDLHPGCGPLGGIETALANSNTEWNLLLPVDLPFVPVAFLRSWAESVIADPEARLAYCEVDGEAHPAMLLIHRATRAHITAALQRGEHKLLPALQAAAGAGLRLRSFGEADERQWFVNVNTPADLEIARHMFALAETGHEALPDAS